MAKCKLDTKKDIVDSVKEVLPIGEGKFLRETDSGDILVNQNRFRENPKQAFSIAQNYVNRLNKQYQADKYGEVAYVKEYSDAIQIGINPSARLVETYHDRYLREQDTKLAQDKIDKDATELGVDSLGESDPSLMSIVDGEDYFLPDAAQSELENEPPAVGVYDRFLQYKENMFATLNQRLSRIRNDKRRLQGDEVALRNLNRLEYQVNQRINGSEERGVVGLKEEIATLKSNPNEMAVKYYIENDLKRLEALSQSTNPSDIDEMKKIINFISAAGQFVIDNETGLFSAKTDGATPNPFFDDKAQYFEGAITPFKKWAEKAEGYRGILLQRGTEFIEGVINSDSKVAQMFGEMEYNDIINKGKGLKDANWIDMWIMDVTNGIFSDNGIIPQVMLSELNRAIDEKLRYARDIEYRINELVPKVEKVLRDKNHGLSSVGILGIKGVSYALFKQKTDSGLDTGNLVNRYSDSFFRARDTMSAQFYANIDRAKQEEDPIEKRKKFAHAYNERKKWYRSNVMVLDITKIPEIINHPDLNEFSEHFKPEEADAYKQQLIGAIGQTAYDEEVAKQVDQIKGYKLDAEEFEREYLADKGVASVDELSEYDKSNLDAWIKRRSPFWGVEDHFNSRGLEIGGNSVYNHMEYNISVPRKMTTGVAVDSNNRWIFGPIAGVASKNTGYWDEQYQEIEKDPTLKQFHEVLTDAFKTVRDNMPEDLYNQVSMNNIPALRRSIIEILSDKNISFLKRISIAIQEFYNRFRQGFGIVKQGDVSYANIDTITGKANYNVNDVFLRGNISKINNAAFIEKRDFLRLWNSREHRDNIKTINRNTPIDLDKLDARKDEDVILKIAQYLHTSPNLDSIRAITGSTVLIGNVIKASATHEAVQQQSFDLPKIAKFFTHLAMEYAGRNQVLPALQTMKEHYEGIANPDTNSSGSPLTNFFTGKGQMNGLRNNAINQMNDWFNRVGLGNYDKKELGVAKGEEDTDPRKTTKDHITHYAKTLTGQKIDKRFYVGEEKRVLDHINSLLGTETDPDIRTKLEKMKAGLGRTYSASSAINSFLNFTRLRALGYNLSAGITNFLDGFNSNILLAASGEYFPPEKIYKAGAIIRNNFLLATPSLGFAKTRNGRKAVILMEKYRILQDSSNELQKSSVKTNFSWLRTLSPYDLVRRVEFINQSPLMIAMLDSKSIKDIDGNEHESVWEALDGKGNLLPQFRTQENIDNWEHMKGEDFHNLKGTLNKMIVRGHGNYDDKRGMMLKSSAVGKAIMMFKTWIPHAMYSRMATEQVDLASGLQHFKGRYRSFTPASGGMFGMIAATTLLGPIAGIPIGLLAGSAMARFKGTSANVSFLNDMAYTGMAMVRKMIGMPINFVAGKEVIKNSKDFDKYLDRGVSQQDVRNMKGNVADMAMLMSWIVLTMLSKMAFYDDDDDKDSVRRRTHNLLMNRYMQMISQAEMFINPRSAYNSTIGDLGILKFYDDVMKTGKLFNDYAQGDDSIIGGMHSGESKFVRQATRTFVPGMFRDRGLIGDAVEGKIPTFGFESAMEQEFPDAKAYPLNRYFHSDEKKAENEITRARSEERARLKKSGEDDDEANKKVNKKFGRKQKDETYEHYRDRLKESGVE